MEKQEMEQLLKELYSCRKCHGTYLKGQVCAKFPEPFLGVLEGSIEFCFIGTNPGETDNSEIRNPNEYMEYYITSPPNASAQWFKGYLEAYKRLVCPEASYKDFCKNTIITNVIKCSTVDTKSIRKKDLEMAKGNCLPFLIKELSIIQPKVLLMHGEFACRTIIEIL